MIEVSQANYIIDYKIYVRFNNGYEMILNLEDYLEGEIYEPLHDVEYFKKFKIELNTITWANGADFAPEFLLQIGENNQLVGTPVHLVQFKGLI